MMKYRSRVLLAFAKAGRDFGFDTIYDLRVEGHIIVRKIDIPRNKPACATMGKVKSKMEVLKNTPTNYQKRLRLEVPGRVGTRPPSRASCKCLTQRKTQRPDAIEGINKDTY